MVAWKSSTDSDKTQAVLVISKDEEMLSVWTTFFKEKNYRVINESDAKNGLQTSQLLTPALIILDIDMPEDKRIEFCQALRSTTDGTLLLLAPRSDVDYYQVGADEVISTPINPMAVLIKSITWLARQEWILPRKETAQVHA